uniref:Uncharacterized protein n=1 Tax=Arundo donax TaxID=35708 RepID=A0A0A9F1W8_ARUDO
MMLESECNLLHVKTTALQMQVLIPRVMSIKLNPKASNEEHKIKIVTRDRLSIPQGNSLLRMCR